jgi:leader peptidase (prepilin peptidase)/N-methyltransferase
MELRCRECGVGIRRREPIIWLLSAAGFAGAVAAVGESWLVWAHLWLVGLTLVLVVTDLDQKLIPNRILFPGTGVAVALLAAGSLLEHRVPDLVRGLGAGLGWFALLYLVALAARGGFGFGDVKLAFVLGVFAGFWSWRTLAVALFLTAMLGGLPALVMIVSRRAGRRDELPYGPAMVFGTWMAIALYAQSLV